jgi:hypothetical protein
LGAIALIVQKNSSQNPKENNGAKRRYSLLGFEFVLTAIKNLLTKKVF